MNCKDPGILHFVILPAVEHANLSKFTLLTVNAAGPLFLSAPITRTCTVDRNYVMSERNVDKKSIISTSMCLSFSAL